jgi:uncharacterized protein YjiS (DUF1127 family)
MARAIGDTSFRELRAACLDWLRHWYLTANVWRWRAYSRRALSRMEQRALRDIGITEAERNLECRKQFWRE